MSAVCEILNGICRLLYRGEYRRFSAECDIGKTQLDYLMKLLKRNSDTVYGRKHGFDCIRSYEDFTRLVPLTVYEDYEKYIEAAAKGEKQVLTKEKITLFELTSGSSGGKKLIPYTKSLKREFQRGIKPWLYDIYSSAPAVCGGKSYWSVTPVTAGKSYSECGIPIGFEEDSEYFGFVSGWLMRRIFAVDGSVKFSRGTEDFYFRTCKQLLDCESLTLVSVWSPSFLRILCDFIRDNSDRLFDNGDPRGKYARENNFSRVFPDLKIISCWADGSAADGIAEIRKRFDGVLIQPKGLLATECFASFPIIGETGGRLSFRSHFFEFRSLENGRIVTAEKLHKGEYELIVTTGGGFYRYCIGDVIEVLDTFPNRPPLLRFLRRKGAVSDLFGEKLTEDFVRGVLRKIGISESFCLLAPEGNRYVLYTDAEDADPDILDAALCEAYHYGYCRSLGQLERAAVVMVKGDPKAALIKKLAADGMRIGDIKPAFLTSKSGWADIFETEGGK